MMGVALPAAVVVPLIVIEVLLRICVMAAPEGIPVPITLIPMARFAVLVSPVTFWVVPTAHVPVCPASSGEMMLVLFKTKAPVPDASSELEAAMPKVRLLV